MRKIRRLSAALAAAAALVSCSSIDCPLNNRVYASFKLAGNVTTLTDTLSVTVSPTPDNADNDTTLINLLTETDSLALPMSYAHEEDTYFFTLRRYGTGEIVEDTVWVSKENLPHFESVDCNPAIFHTINGVRYTTNAIDSIKINNKKVTYNDAKAHFMLYLKDSND